MVPIRGEWTRFKDAQDQLDHYRRWGLIPEKSKQLRPIMVTDGYFGIPEPCAVVGYQTDTWAVIELCDGYHAIHGDYLAELQPAAQQRLPYGMCFADILRNYVVVDIETTGFDFHNDRIIEIAAITYEYGKKTGEFSTFINPERKLSQDIVTLTGITQEEVDTAPKLETVSADFLAFIGDLPIVGHNAVTFDVPFLSTQIAPLKNPVIDTLPLARRVFDLLPMHKLEYLKTVLELNALPSHRAITDVETTNSLLWACLAPRRYEGKVFRAYLDRKSGRECKAPPKQKVTRKSADTPKKAFEHVNIKSIVPTETVTASAPLHGKNVVFTGALSIDRGTAMQMAVNAGAVLKSSVSKKTDYLIVGKQDKDLVGTDGKSSKEEKAESLNQSGAAEIKVISEKEFLELIGEGAKV